MRQELDEQELDEQELDEQELDEQERQMNFEIPKRVVVLAVASIGLAFGACTTTSDGASKDCFAGSGGESNGGASSGGESNGGSQNPGGSGSITDAGAAGTDVVDVADAGAAGEGGAPSVSNNAGAAGMEAAAGAWGGPECGDGTPQVPQTGTTVQSASGAPSITAVSISRIGPNVHIEVSGAGFGTAPGTLPAVTSFSQFTFTDITQGKWTAGGPASPVHLQYTSWTDARIVIDGFGTQYGGTYKMSVGDTVSIFVRSTEGTGAGPSATWTGTVKSTPPPPPAPDGPTPHVCAATFSRIGQNMHIELEGAGFGTAPGTLPAVTSFGQFSFTDITQGRWTAGGAASPVHLQYTSWTDARIVIDGFGTQYGATYKVAEDDAVSIFIRNSSGPEFTTWTGKLTASAPPTPMPNDPNPQVVSVTFDQVGPDMRIEVNGAGFGDAPGTLPAVTSFGQFSFTDIAQGRWTAGGAASPVNLRYTSWTDARIVIDGFGPQYGATYKVASGDAVSIFIKNSVGPEFSVWTGELP